MIGADTLVPPNTCHPGAWKVSYTATPVRGSPTAETSATVRRAQPGSAWNTGLASNAEQPLPAPLHAVSVHPRPPPERTSEVPPTAVTYCDDAGKERPKPSSPELAVMTTPGWLRNASSCVCAVYSAAPKLLDTYVAPRFTAVLIAVNRSLVRLVVASTSRIWQLGQTAETIWMSREISAAQPALGAGSGPARPFWFTLRKQPLAVVHGGRPNCAR